MSATAESFQHITVARRNAIVLAVAQALAGGNNTVIVSTASIVGAVLAPDKGLATLPVTAMVFGMWLGTLPLGALAPLQTPLRPAMRLGFRHFVRVRFILGSDERQFLGAAHRHFLRRALRGGTY